MYIIRISNNKYLAEFSIYSFYSTTIIEEAKKYNTLVGARKGLDILAKRTGLVLNIIKYNYE